MTTVVEAPVQEDPGSDPDDFPMEDLSLDYPVEEKTVTEPVPVPEIVEADQPLLSLDDAVDKVPEDLRRQMEELLRAEFREVRRWTPPKG